MLPLYGGPDFSYCSVTFTWPFILMSKGGLSALEKLTLQA